MSLLCADLPQVELSQSAIPSAGLVPASEAAAAALEHLLAVAGLGLEPGQVREVLWQGGLDADAAASLPAPAPGDPPGPRESWESVLTGAGEALGLRVLGLQLSVREVAARTEEAPLPLLVLPVERDESAALAPQWRVVHQRCGQRLLVGTPGESALEPGQWLTVREFAALLGVREDEPLTYLTAVPATPAASQSSTPGPSGRTLLLASDPGHGHAGGPAPSPPQRLLALLRSESLDLGVILIYAAAIGLLTLATPVAVQALVNQVAFGQLLQPVVVLTLMLLLGLGLSCVLRALQTCAVELLQQRLFVRLAADLAHRLPRVRSDAFTAEHGPEVTSRFLEIATLQKSAAALLLDGLAVALQALIGLAVLAFYHPVLLAFDAVLLGCIAFILTVLGRGAVRTSIAESRAKYAVADWLQELARRPVAIRLGRGATLASERADGLVRQYLGARRAHFRVLLRQVVASLGLQALASAGLLGAGGALVIAGQLTLGQLVAAELIVSAVVAGVAKFGKHLESFYDLLASLDKVGHLLDLPLERADGELLPALQSASGLASEQATGLAVRLRGVAVGGFAGKALLRELHLEVAAGERVAIVGPSGGGRSLLSEVLVGLRPPLSGSIELDERDTRALRPAAVRALIAFLHSGSRGLLAGTIAEFLHTAAPSASRFQMQRALSTAGLWSTIAALPQGLDTPLGSDALVLSDRQRARLRVAHAVLQRPRLIVIDLPLDGGAGLDEIAPLLAPAAPWTVILCAPTALELPSGITKRYELRDGALLPLAAAGGRP